MFLIILGTLFSCKKREDNILLEGQNSGGVGILQSDTFFLETSTVLEDSLPTSVLSNQLLGEMNDPLFGTSKASIFTEFRLPQLNNIINTAGNVLDSAVLTLNFTSTIVKYGNLSTPQTFEVYELSEPMSNSIYYSNNNIAYNPTLVGSVVSGFNLTDSVTVKNGQGFKKIAPSLRISLSNALASKLFNATSSDLSSQQNFLNFFKGLAIVPSNGFISSGNGAIIGINLKNIESKITLYYNDTLESNFIITNECKRFSKYQHSNRNSQILHQLNNSNGNFDTTYVQSMASLKTFIKTPYLFSLISNGKKILVNKAEIKLNIVENTNTSQYPIPSRLYLVKPNETDNKNEVIEDFFSSDTNYYGGNYNSTLNQYTFYCTRYFQNVFNQYSNNGLNKNKGLFVIIPSDYPITPSRLMIDTRKGTPKKIMLILTYSYL